MKTIKEVCAITGVTRRTLQEYERIGLLPPSNATTRKQSEPWLYSDDDIRMLIRIQILFASGMKRKDIMQLLEENDFSTEQVLTVAITNLQKEKARIAHLIRKMEMLYGKLSEGMVMPDNPAELFSDSSFFDWLHEKE